MKMTNEHIYGDQEISDAQKHISNYKDIGKYTLHLVGFGSPPANLNTKYSFGSFYKINSVQERCYTVEIWSWKTMVVLFVAHVLRNQWNIFS